MQRKAELWLCALLFATPAQASVNVKGYTAAKAKGGDAWFVVQTYLAGVAEGFNYANIIVAGENEKPLYCPPDNLALNLDNYISIVDNEMKSSKLDGDTGVEVILVFGLRHLFPCTK